MLPQEAQVAEHRGTRHQSAASRRQTKLVGLCACALPLLTYVLAWCAIGQQSFPDGWRQINWVHPLFPRQTEVVAGIVSAVLLAPVLFVLIRAVRRRQLTAPWTWITGLVTAYAAWSAFAGRVVTAEAYGANIGGGFMIFMQIPLTAGVAAVVIVHAAKARRRHHTGRSTTSK
ncbi:MAG: hypothetical protein ACRD0W_18090 [Acidimicrobiales bacterium]